MNIIRFLNERETTVLGVWEEELVYEITSVGREHFHDLLSLAARAKREGICPSELIEATNYKETAPVYKYKDVTLLTPVEAPEVWAAGVTYEDSRKARNVELQDKTDGDFTIYDQVYAAQRPELFLKSTAARTVAPNQALCIRSDSEWQIPEPEVGLVIDSQGDIIGFTAGNDMSSRDIEGENALYLPQAKVWRNSCSFGPSVRLAETVEDPYQLQINCKIYRDEEKVFEGSANTSQLKRTFDTLVHYLLRDNVVFDGTVLLTGTCIVPPDDFTLAEGDRIEIEVSGIGTLVNSVEKVSTNMAKQRPLKLG